MVHQLDIQTHCAYNIRNMTKDTRLWIRIDRDLKEKFLKLLDKRKTSISKWIRQSIESFVESEQNT